MSYRIWETTDGRFAVSMIGQRHETFDSFASADTWAMFASKLDAFLETPITGEQITAWMDVDRRVRERWEKREALAKEE